MYKAFGISFFEGCDVTIGRNKYETSARVGKRCEIHERGHVHQTG